MVTLTVCNPNQKKVAEDLERQARGEPEPAKGNEMHLFIYLYLLLSTIEKFFISVTCDYSCTLFKNPISNKYVK